MKPKILIVDDHEIVREGIRTLLGRLRPDWEICGEGANGNEAIEAVKSLSPDLLLMDVTMPVLSGLEATARMRKLGLQCPILVFTMHQSDSLSAEVRDAGAQGYVVKSQAARDLIQAIEVILGGGTFFSMPGLSDPRPDRGPGRSGLVFRMAFAY